MSYFSRYLLRAKIKKDQNAERNEDPWTSKTGVVSNDPEPEAVELLKLEKEKTTHEDSVTTATPGPSCGDETVKDVDHGLKRTLSPENSFVKRNKEENKKSVFSTSATTTTVDHDATGQWALSNNDAFGNMSTFTDALQELEPEKVNQLISETNATVLETFNALDNTESTNNEHHGIVEDALSHISSEGFETLNESIEKLKNSHYETGTEQLDLSTDATFSGIDELIQEDLAKNGHYSLNSPLGGNTTLMQNFPIHYKPYSDYRHFPMTIQQKVYGDPHLTKREINTTHFTFDETESLDLSSKNNISPEFDLEKFVDAGILQGDQSPPDFKLEDFAGLLSSPDEIEERQPDRQPERQPEGQPGEILRHDFEDLISFSYPLTAEVPNPVEHQQQQQQEVIGGQEYYVIIPAEVGQEEIIHNEVEDENMLHPLFETTMPTPAIAGPSDTPRHQYHQMIENVNGKEMQHQEMIKKEPGNEIHVGPQFEATISPPAISGPSGTQRQQQQQILTYGHGNELQPQTTIHNEVALEQVIDNHVPSPSIAGPSGTEKKQPKVIAVIDLENDDPNSALQTLNDDEWQQTFTVQTEANKQRPIGKMSKTAKSDMMLIPKIAVRCLDFVRDKTDAYSGIIFADQLLKGGTSMHDALVEEKPGLENRPSDLRKTANRLLKNFGIPNHLPGIRQALFDNGCSNEFVNYSSAYMYLHTETRRIRREDGRISLREVSTINEDLEAPDILTKRKPVVPNPMTEETKPTERMVVPDYVSSQVLSRIISRNEAATFNVHGYPETCGLDVKLAERHYDRGMYIGENTVNKYLDLIVKRNKTNATLPRINVQDTAKLYDLSNQMSNEQRTEMFDKSDIIMMPKCLDDHWVLYVADLRKNNFTLYDSLQAKGIASLDNQTKMVKQWVEAQYAAHSGILGSKLEEAEVQRADISLQPRGVDKENCGVYLLKYADNIAQDKKPNFQTEWRGEYDLTFWRRFISHELQHQRLLTQDADECMNATSANFRSEAMHNECDIMNLGFRNPHAEIRRHFEAGFRTINDAPRQIYTRSNPFPRCMTCFACVNKMGFCLEIEPSDATDPVLDQ